MGLNETDDGKRQKERGSDRGRIEWNGENARMWSVESSCENSASSRASVHGGRGSDTAAMDSPKSSSLNRLPVLPEVVVQLLNIYLLASQILADL